MAETPRRVIGEADVKSLGSQGAFGIEEAIKKLPKSPDAPEFASWKDTGVGYLFDLASEGRVNPDDIVALKDVFAKAVVTMSPEDRAYNVAETFYQHLGAFSDGLDVGRGRTPAPENVHITPKLKKQYVKEGYEGIQKAAQLLAETADIPLDLSTGDMLNDVLLQAGTGRVSAQDVQSLYDLSWDVIDKNPARSNLEQNAFFPISKQLIKFDAFIKGVNVGKISS